MLMTMAKTTTGKTMGTVHSEKTWGGKAILFPRPGGKMMESFSLGYSTFTMMVEDLATIKSHKTDCLV